VNTICAQELIALRGTIVKRTSCFHVSILAVSTVSTAVETCKRFESINHDGLNADSITNKSIATSAPPSPPPPSYSQTCETPPVKMT
jgi:hypothetical protein